MIYLYTPTLFLALLNKRGEKKDFIDDDDEITNIKKQSKKFWSQFCWIKRKRNEPIRK